MDVLGAQLHNGPAAAGVMSVVGRAAATAVCVRRAAEEQHDLLKALLGGGVLRGLRQPEGVELLRVLLQDLEDILAVRRRGALMGSDGNGRGLLIVPGVEGATAAAEGAATPRLAGAIARRIPAGLVGL